MNGHTATAATLGLIRGSIVNTSQDSASLTASRYLVFNGSIDVDLYGAAPLNKCSDGLVTLRGTNNYTGLTTINAGELKFVGQNAWNPTILYGAGADIQDGRLVLDYTADPESNPAETVLSILAESYGNGTEPFAYGQIHSSTAAATSTALGWTDNTTDSQVTITRALYGDANLDGSVDFSDLDLWMANAGCSGATWSQADFTYDGAVDVAELDLWMANAGNFASTALPTVVAIARLGSETTNANTVQFAVVFSKPVTGVDAADFNLDSYSTAASGTIDSVEAWSTSGAIYLVTVNNVSGDGTLGLNLTDNNTIVDANDNTVPLVGPTGDDGSFIGDTYTVSSAFVWDGGGSDALWTTADNWAGDVAPQPGDRLRFISTETDPYAENNFAAGTSFTSVEFASNGFTLTGNTFTVTNGLFMPMGTTSATIAADVALDGYPTVNVAEPQGQLTLTGDLSGTGSLTKTGDGTLALLGTDTHTGGTTCEAGSIAIPSVFTAALDAGVTFSTERPNAMQAANPSKLGTTCSVTVNDNQSLGGWLTMTLNGVLSWSPDPGCPSGTYTVTATYNYIGGSQTKQFSLTIADEDMPPTFWFEHPSPDHIEHNWNGHDESIQATEFQAIPDRPDVYEYAVQLQKAYDHEGAVTYELIVESPYDSLPLDAAIDANAVFSCKFALPSENYTVYQFEVKATDSTGHVDLRHVVLGVNGGYQGLDATILATNNYATVGKGSSDNRIALGGFYATGQRLTASNAVLVIDVEPAHGQLADDPSNCSVVYTPTAGYRGLDEFYYHWEYDTFNYDAPHEKTGTAITNTSREQIQVGNWIDLVPETTYQPGKSLLAVGSSETTTLTLQNPRGDDISTTGFWSLNFEPSMIRVYDPQGNEIISNTLGYGAEGSTYLKTVSGEETVTLTVVGVGAGEAHLQAFWHTYACDIGQNDQRWYPSWHWNTSQTVNFAVMGLIWEGEDITNKNVAVKAGRRIELSVAGVPDGVAANYSWSLDGSVFLDDYVKDFDPYKSSDQVTYLSEDDYHLPVLSFVWVAGGADRWASVSVAGKTLTTSFAVNRPAVTVTTLENQRSDDQGENGVNVKTYANNSVTGAIAFEYDDLKGDRTVGINFDAKPKKLDGFQTCFCQIVNSAKFEWLQGLSRDGDTHLENKLDNGFPYVPESTDGLSAWDSPSVGTVYKPSFHDGRKLTATYSFSMWLMGHPLDADSIWIPLVRVDWNLSWTVIFDDGISRFKVLGAEHSVTTNHDTTLCPTWDGTVTNNSIQLPP